MYGFLIMNECPFLRMIDCQRPPVRGCSVSLQDPTFSLLCEKGEQIARYSKLEMNCFHLTHFF